MRKFCRLGKKSFYRKEYGNGRKRKSGFSPAAAKAKAEADKGNLLQIERAVQLYYLDTGKYPDKLEALTVRPVGEDKWRGPYLQNIPVYPYDSKLHYAVTEKGTVVVR
jgi:hypothetical protein